MLNGQSFNPNPADISQLAKLGKPHFQPPAEAAKETQSKPENVATQNAVNWFTLEDGKGGLKLTAVPNTTQVDVTSVSIHQESVAAPRGLNFFGYKIDLGSKMAQFKENYVKNFSLSKSHNLMVARFAQLKTAFFGQLLSMLGCTSEELRKLQREAIDSSTKQNKILFEENEYNSELLSILGGGGKKMAKQQERITGEIRNQLIAQAKNLGMGDYYVKEKILEIQLEQCQKIMSKFVEERNTLNYQLAFFGVN